MKCPACGNNLKELRVENLAVDVCDPGCGGIWFDAFELQQVDEPDEKAGAKLVRAAASSFTSSATLPDGDAKRVCPRCPDIKLKKHFFSPKRRVYVDQCPNCGGYWLDKGELEAIRAETGQAALEEKGPRLMPMETIRLLYRLKTRDRDIHGSPPTA